MEATPQYPAGTLFHVEFSKWLAKNNDGIERLKKLGVPPGFSKSFATPEYQDNFALRYAPQVLQGSGLDVHEFFFREALASLDECEIPHSCPRSYLETIHLLKHFTSEHGLSAAIGPLEMGFSDYARTLKELYACERYASRPMLTRILKFIRSLQDGVKPPTRQEVMQQRAARQGGKARTVPSQQAPKPPNPKRASTAEEAPALPPLLPKLPSERRTVDHLVSGLGIHADLMGLCETKLYVDGDRMKILRALSKILAAAGITTAKLKELRSVQAIDPNSVLGQLLGDLGSARPATQKKKG